MTKALELWKCGACNEVHKHEEDALGCCRPDVHEVYGCPVCEKVHGDETDALKCCGADGGITKCPCCARDYATSEINHHAVVVAGHCNVCQPMFTVEQQLEIEDRFLATGPRDFIGLLN